MTQTLERIRGAALDDLSFEQFVFDDADWRFYETILRKVGERRIFVTFAPACEFKHSDCDWPAREPTAVGGGG